MASYPRGAKGPEIERMQARLQELGRYTGPIDGDFGEAPKALSSPSNAQLG